MPDAYVLLTLLGIAGIIVLYARSQGWEEEGRRRRAAAKRREEELTYGLAALTVKHEAALFLRLRQASYKDPYGNWVMDKCRKEVDYFFEHVVVAELRPATADEFVLVREPFWGWLAESFPAVLLGEEGIGAEKGDGLAYERQIAARLTAAGFSVTCTPLSGDQGVDLVAERDGGRIAIQCKNYAKPAGNDAVQQVYAGARFYDAARAVVVAPNGFTVAARQLASSLRVECLHEDELLDALT